MPISRNTHSPYQVTKSSPTLYELLRKEVDNLNNVYNQIKQSPLHHELYRFEDVYFVADGFEGAPLRLQLVSKMELFLAVRRQAGLEVHRGLKFCISPVTLFYSSVRVGSRQVKLGIVSERDDLIRQLSKMGDKLILRPSPKAGLTFEIDNNMKIAEDFGEAVTSFQDGLRLGCNPLSEKILTARYAIAGASHYSTMPVKDGTLCVLVTESDNPYDDHAILLLRWVPCMKSEFGNAYLHPLYKMAYISRCDNRDLHEEMVRTGNHILFGRVEKATVSILGNATALDKQPIADYVLPYSLFNSLND